MIRIHDEADEIDVRLRLYADGGIVTLEAVDDDGTTITNILSITDEGVVRYSSVNTDLGLPLDAQGRVKIVRSA